jgi:SHS2 domain-containing protein
MTDAEIEAYGANIDEAFQNAGRAVEQLMVNLGSIDREESREIKVSGRDLESLLYDWIEALISIQDEDGLLFSSFVCKVTENSSGYILLAEVEGEKFNPEKHEQKTAIKAPTFHDMKISQGVDKVTMRFLIDL